MKIKGKTPKATLVAIALGLALVSTGPTAAASLCNFDEIAIFAFNSVHINRDATVAGDVVANSESPGPVLDEGAEVALDRGSVVTGNVSGHTIDLDKTSKIDGSATYVEIVNQGTITGTQTIGAPPYTDVPSFQSASPGGDDVFVGPLDTVILGDEGFCSVTTAQACTPSGPLCPGTETCVRAPVTVYNNIQLTGGTVIFSGGGPFAVASVTGFGAVRFDAPTALRVAGRFNLSMGPSTIGPSSGSGIGPSDIVIYVEGGNGGSGLLGSPLAFRVNQNSSVAANVYAPNGTIKIDQFSTVAGALLARDVRIERSVQVVLDSAFENKAPTADPQGLEGVTGAVTIELTGSDPEGDSLAFSIEVPGSGALGSIVPIQDDGQCSETVQACGNANPPCPGTETCVLPPITRATVLYTPSCAADCPADAFTFGVTDACGVLATAVVSINPDDPSGPPPPINQVVADDVEVDVAVSSTSQILLSAGAPPSVASLTFTVETLPGSGTITDEFEGSITLGGDLPSPIVVYTAPASAGVANFTFSARDSTTSLPCNTPSCDTGTVNITIGELPPLAQPLSVETSVNQPIEITLQGNPGGTGTPSFAGPQAQQRVTSSGYTYYYEAQAISTRGGNGGPSKDSDAGKRGLAAASQTLTAGLAFDAGWTATSSVPPAFFWSGGNGAIAGDNFTFSGAGCLSVTDDFDKGDQFTVYDNGSPIFTTSSVPAVSALEVGPDAAYLDPTYSSGSFSLGAGAHDITIEVTVSPYGGGRGYIRVDSGSCLPNLEVTSFSAPSSAALDEPIGGQILATVTNTGFAAMAPNSSSIGYYISTDAVITTADRLLAGGRENMSQQAPNGLAVGESVQINLFSGANIGSQFPDENPPSGSVYIGVLVDEFNQVVEGDEGDNTASAPIDILSGSAPLVYSVATLPPAGAGTLTFGGSAVFVGQTFNVAPTLLFTPTLAFTGSTSFQYSVTQGALSSTAVVGILVNAFDTCIVNGRPVGCAPGGGGGFQAQGPSQAALEREVAAGPSKGLSITVEGSGSVATSPVELSGNRVLHGLICHSGNCNKLLPEGAEITLYARPEGDSSEFVRWGGACFGNEPITTVRLSEHTLCTAVFGKKAGK